jgi:hypothetical protein
MKSYTKRKFWWYENFKDVELSEISYKRKNTYAGAMRDQ